MLLLPIDTDQTKNVRFKENPECVPILNVYPDFYQRVGYNKPWIGYFVTIDRDEIVGAGGYKGKPRKAKLR
jgi:hypothetical protein